MGGINRQRPPFRAEHLGSLLRPPRVLEAQAAFRDNTISESTLTTIEDEEIKDVVKLQQDVRLHGITDGEYRRQIFWGPFFVGLEGFEDVENKGPDDFRLYVPDTAPYTMGGPHQPKTYTLCTGKIKHVGSVYVNQWIWFRNLFPADQQHEIKLTFPAPEWFHLRYKPGRAYPTSVYATDAEYFADIATAYRTELDILYRNGLKNVQIDDPNLAYFCDQKMLDGLRKDGIDPDALFDSYIQLYNSCLARRPADLHVAVHICRGNGPNRGFWSEGSYEVIASRLFRQLDVDTFCLEYDTPRAGGFEPLKLLPSHKNVILGLVSSKNPELEDPEVLKGRLYQAADVIAEGTDSTRETVIKRLGVSPQCGFASVAQVQNMSRDEMIAKLKLVRRVADDIWPGEP